MPHATMKRLSASSLRKQRSMDVKGSSADGSGHHSNKTMSSTMTPKRRTSIQDLHSSRPTKRSLPRPPPGARNISAIGNLVHAASVKRWNGNRRTTSLWDSLRRDSELWFPQGDCLIHFYEYGQSRRGASLRVSLADIEASNCHPFLRLYPPRPLVESPSTNSSSSNDADFFSVSSSDSEYEIYVPAPPDLSREDAFRYHLTTRNFFAWMFNIPVVGDRLGEALIALLDRMMLYRFNPTENQDDILAYLDSQDYADFRECPDHSLAVLQFAERFECRELWTDAFAHCVGMNDDLILSAEFEHTSRISKALITRAHLEMELRLERAGKGLGDFLEDDLSEAHIGLGKGARLHLERFRSFLHSFYVGKYGYWPPASTKKNSTALPRSTCRSMYFDFRRLYEYLVDPTSSISIQDNRPADGGICVLQNLANFDKRNKYTSLQHPLPLVPETSEDMLRLKSSAMMKLFGNRQAKADRRTAALTSLSAATNSSSIAVMECALVREYLRFEKSWTMKESETVACADARKVRWILIYTTLQTLISITRAPTEVRDTEGVSYPLCCQVAGTPPWQLGANAKTGVDKEDAFLVAPLKKVIEIKPEVEYHPSRSSQKAVSPERRSTPSTPRRVSVGEDLTLRSPVPRKTSSCGILIPGYGENAQSVDIDSDSSTPVSSAVEASGGWSSSSSEDGMEHTSVNGSVSVYDDNDEEKPSSQSNVTQSARKESMSSFRQDTCNPEVEQYIWA